jgi:hypothetical protein
MKRVPGLCRVFVAVFLSIGGLAYGQATTIPASQSFTTPPGMTAAQYCVSFTNTGGFFDGPKACTAKDIGWTYVSQKDSCAAAPDSVTSVPASQIVNPPPPMTSAKYCSSFTNTGGFFDGPKACSAAGAGTYVSQGDSCSVVSPISAKITGAIKCSKPSNSVTVSGTITCTKPQVDISLLKTKSGTNYLITLVNSGSPLVGPAKITVQDALPGGLTITGGSGGGVSGAKWTLSPGAGTSGPQQITLTYTIGSGITVPTGGQIASFGLNVAVDIKKNCATAQLTVNNVAVTESNVANNTACAQ